MSDGGVTGQVIDDEVAQFVGAGRDGYRKCEDIIADPDQALLA